jgi:hypothetical protein
VISVSGFAITIVDDPDSCPSEQLIFLRRQAEGLAKQERLFEVKSKNWLSWEDAQRARVSAVEKYFATKERGKQQTLLRECMLLAFMTLQPPDRVGVIRRLRLGEGGSIYKKGEDELYTVDLSSLKHKTSRFYGPSVSSLPSAIGEWVAKYEQSIVFEMLPPNPYLFSLASDWNRGMSSSQWCSFVKAIFLKHAGVATPPKLLRASFCTHLRSSDGVDDELLESCAKAMKHNVATQGGSHYDKEANDRLLKKAHDFCSEIASKFPDPAPQIISIPGTFNGVLSTEKAPADGYKLFVVKIPWNASFYAGADLLFPTKPPLGEIKFKVPANISQGNSISIRVQTKSDSLTLTGLQLTSGAKVSEASSSTSAPPHPPPPVSTTTAGTGKKPSRALKQLAEFFESGDKWLPAKSSRRQKKD